MLEEYVLEEYVEDNYYARFDTPSYHHYRETHFNARLDVNHDKVTGVPILGQGYHFTVCASQVCRHNYYAMSDTRSYHCFRETHFNA